MKLKRFLLRYFPPGIILEYEQGGEVRSCASSNTPAAMPASCMHVLSVSPLRQPLPLSLSLSGLR